MKSKENVKEAKEFIAEMRGINSDDKIAEFIYHNTELKPKKDRENSPLTAQIPNAAPLYPTPANIRLHDIITR